MSGIGKNILLNVKILEINENALKYQNIGEILDAEKILLNIRKLLKMSIIIQISDKKYS